MRSKEFIKEAGRNGSFDDSGMPINQIPTDAEYAARQAQGQKNLDALKGFGSKIAGAFKGNNQAATPADDDTEPGYVVGADGNPITSADGTPWRTPNSRIPKAKAMPAYQARDLRDPNSLNQPADVALPQTQRNLRDPNLLNQPAPAYVDRIPAVKPVEPAPAPVQNADPVPSFRVPGAAQAGQGGYNYTTGVAQDRPHATNAGADEITRNDLPFVPYTGPEPKSVVKPVVKPVQNPEPIPRRKVPKSVVQVSPDKQNLATTKTTLTPDEIKAAQEALRDPTIGARDKAYYTELLKNQSAQPSNNATPVATKEPIYRGSESGKDYVNPAQLRGAQPAAASATPATAGSVVVKSGDTLSKIAAANGTTVQAIMAANPSIKDANKIAAGQTVKLRESSDVARIRHLAGLTRN